MRVLVIYENSMVVDCAAAAFLQMVDPNLFTISGHSRSTALTEESFPEKPAVGYWDMVVVIGTYWSREDNTFSFLSLSKDIRIFSFGDEVSNIPATVTYADQENCLGPLRFAIDLARNHVSPGFVSLFTNSRSELIKLIDERALGHNVIGTQPFFTGFFNYFQNADGSNNTEETCANFIRLFTGEVDFREVQTMGQTIYEAQIQMANERAANNSKVVTLKNGKTALITEAPDLCNLSHRALQQMSPHPVTITVKFSFPTDTLHYSVRTYDGTDARDIVKAIDGGGSDFAAGGKVDFDLQVPF